MAPPPDVPIFEKYSQRVSTDLITGHVLMKPSPLCMEKISEPECGHGKFIMSGKEIYVGEKPEHFYNGKPFSQLDRESMKCPAKECYAPLTAFIINTCEKFNCSEDVQKFKIKLDGLDGIKDVINGVPQN